MFDGRDLLSLSFKEMREVRGDQIAMAFQDPMTSLNPAFTIGTQLVDTIRLHRTMSKSAARNARRELLELVGIPDPERRLGDYPHQLSGGMRQRALLALALSCEPKLLIADEPTTALDVTVQAQILDLIRSLQERTGMAVIFVTHDLGVVADLCSRVLVMYAGQVVEEAPVEELFAHPRHPYTEGLLAAIPQAETSGERLASIPGVVPSAIAMPTGCRFHPRCPYATPECETVPVELTTVSDGHRARAASGSTRSPSRARDDDRHPRRRAGRNRRAAVGHRSHEALPDPARRPAPHRRSRRARSTASTSRSNRAGPSAWWVSRVRASRRSAAC